MADDKRAHSDIRPVLDQDFPLDEIAGAFAHQASQKHFGKIKTFIPPQPQPSMVFPTAKLPTTKDASQKQSTSV